MSTPATLRPFDKQDFAMFAGVETATPLINFQGDHAVIVDGTHLEFCTMDADGDPSSFIQDYQCPATAEAVGNDILAMVFKDFTVASIVDRFSLQAI